MRPALGLAALLVAAASLPANAALLLDEVPLAGPPYSLFLDPGETVRLQVTEADSWEIRTFDAAPGTREGNAWTWRAPEAAGIEDLEFAADGEAVALRIWVGTALPSGTAELDGYRIGAYPPARPGAVDYRAPRALHAVGARQTDEPVSRHFRIGQFLCKQPADWPRFLRLDERLLALLDEVVAELRAQGHAIDTLGVISGYRTPEYNAAIGNVPYSRHVYGDAMDIFVDADGDGRMDDLDGNGRTDRADLLRLRDLVAAVMARNGRRLQGGLGVYPPTGVHGGFLHVDTRGVPARW